MGVPDSTRQEQLRAASDAKNASDGIHFDRHRGASRERYGSSDRQRCLHVTRCGLDRHPVNHRQSPRDSDRHDETGDRKHDQQLDDAVPDAHEDAARLRFLHLSMSI